MRSIRTISLIVVTFLYGIPLPVQGQTSVDMFALPEARIGVAYRTNLEAVLRNTYRLKLETDARAPMFRWSIAGGELPPGLVLRNSGLVVGVPRVGRDEPYVFQLQVIDLASPGTAALTLTFSLRTRAATAIRLSHVNAVKVVSLGGSDDAVKATRRNDSDPSSAGDSSQLTTGNDLNRSSLVAGNVKRFSAEDIYASMLKPPVHGQLTQAMVEPSSAVRSDAAATTSAKGFSSKGAAAPEPPVPAPQKTLEINVGAAQTTGDKIRGPATIKLRNLNRLRYDIKIGKEVTFSAGPDLKLPFIPPIPAQAQKDNSKVAAPALGIAGPPADFATAFNAIVDLLNAIEAEKSAQVNANIVAATNATNTAKANLESLVSSSDSILTTAGGAQAIVDSLPQLIGTSAAPGGDIVLALSHSWPDAKIENLLGRLAILSNDLLTLPTKPLGNWNTWYNNTPGNKSAYDAANARISDLRTQLAGLNSAGPQGVAFQNAQNKLRIWRPILIGLRDGGAAGFTESVRVGCGFAFDGNKETKVSVVKRDRLAEPGAAPTTEEVITVVCSSPLSVSAGFGFSAVNETEFVFVPSTKSVTANGQTTTTVINRFGFKNKSGFRTLPVLLLNTRIWEPNDTIALHLSTGAAVDVKSGQGGTDLEYIVGPSFSFWRSLFITTGFHIGRVPKLAGGFSIDQEVPTGISEPPIEKAWKKGVVTTFTYKIR